jgi:hypothetical protein
MKFLIMTSPDSKGLSEVFYALLVPNGIGPGTLVERWESLVENSPINVIYSGGKENLSINALWDESSEEFSKPENKEVHNRKNITDKTYSFLIDDEVVSIMTITEDFGDDSKLEAAFSDPVIVKSVDDDSKVDLGYIWDGTNFLEPESN